MKRYRIAGLQVEMAVGGRTLHQAQPYETEPDGPADFQIRCSIAAFDAFAVLVLADGKQELIYKHAISTIIPSVPVKTD